MAIYGPTMLVNDGQVTGSVIQSNIFTVTKSNFAIPPNARHTVNPDGSQNMWGVVWDNTGKPADYNPTNNRHTLSIDLCFAGNYLGSTHMGILARHKGGATPYIQGDNRSGGVILGSWLAANMNAVALEEVEIRPDFHWDKADLRGNGNGTAAVNAVQPYRWYRVTVDSIVYNGQIAHEIRVDDKATGARVYTETTNWSNYSPNFAAGRDAGKALFFSIGNYAADGSELYYTNFRSYWSLGGEWVATP